ncbi:MAG: hypothetical protein DMF64_01550 [Acidobacteria bacterium]|nr:MAG: hypothetical protein DMF64_01550 [Acidobacteriota bacterium]
MTTTRLLRRLRTKAPVRRRNSQITPTILILLGSMAAVVCVTWLAPSLSAATGNMLFRLRGAIQPPDDIVIVAIDDGSLQQIGNWPWPRSVMASVLDRITSAHPRAVGLDVIYAERSERADDQLLADAIRHAGRVVLPAQLIESETTQADSRGSATWLLPLPEIKGAAVAVGHAHADPDVDGVLRTIQLSKADEQGERLWSFGLETLRVAEQLPPRGIEEKNGSLRLGRYEIGVHDEAEKATLPGVTIIRPNEMFINYLGPPRTFPYYSIADVLNEHVPAATFSNKIVLIGAVAQTMGDTRITPFISYGGAERQSGIGMPGVEVHANVIETIRRGAWLRPLPDWLSFGLALLFMLGAAVIIKLLDGWRVIVSLSALLGLIIIGSLYLFDHYFIIPPVVPVLTGFVAVVPLLLLNSSITASRDLDQKLERLARIQQRFMAHKPAADSCATALSFLGSILRADTVALCQPAASGQALELTAYVGRKPDERELVSVLNMAATISNNAPYSLQLPLIVEAEVFGLLLIKRTMGAPFAESELRLAHEFAGGLAAKLKTAQADAQLKQRSLPISLPRNITWKLRAVDEITAQLIARIGFMNLVFTSMTDGLLVADITGRVVFANPAARRFWAERETDTLNGRSLDELFVAHEIIALDELRATMRGVLSGQSVLLDVELLGREGRFYTLQFSAVNASDDLNSERQTQMAGAHDTAPGGPGIIGLIVIITDVTKRRELERVKAETLQLVSHELRAPLTSIRGLSDLLLKYPVPEAKTHELLETIYSESVRMNELINRYLDLTRIEYGAQTLTRAPVATNNLIAECVRALSPMAAEKGIHIIQRLEGPSPSLLADAQLLTQAVNNLLSNAIKYSPTGLTVEIGTDSDDAYLRIYVRDHGYGIPPEAQARVFEKFYRLERDAKSDVVGTGLGLALVKEIVERHGGRVTLASAPNEGSTFTLLLSLQKEQGRIV